MTRQSRKRFERIHTRRAKAGFPRVSPAILHNDGTIEAVPRARYRVSFSPTFEEQQRALPSSDRPQRLKKNLGKYLALKFVNNLLRLFGCCLWWNIATGKKQIITIDTWVNQLHLKEEWIVR